MSEVIQNLPEFATAVISGVLRSVKRIPRKDGNGDVRIAQVVGLGESLDLFVPDGVTLPDPGGIVKLGANLGLTKTKRVGKEGQTYWNDVFYIKGSSLHVLK
jgi:hypothetical protein